MLIALLITDKAVPQEITVAKVKEVTVTEMQVENLRRMGLNDQAAELARGKGRVIDNEQMRVLGELKDRVYLQRKNPFLPPSSYKPLWESLDGYLAASTLEEKYHDVAKDPRSDTLFAAVIKEPDSIIVYKGVIDWATPTITWTQWVSYGYPGPLMDPSITVTGRYIFVGFSKYYDSTDIDPRILKINRFTASTYLYYISLSGNLERATVITSDYEQYSTGYWIYFAYWDDNKDSVMFVRITNPDTTTFTSYGGIAYAAGTSPNVQRLSIDYFYSGSSKLFIAYTSNDSVFLANGSPFGSSWTARSATFTRGYFPHIKGRREGPYLAVVYSYPYYSTDYDCYMQYSTNAGSTFTQYGCSASFDDELWPTVAFAADSVWVAMLKLDKETPIDSLTDTAYVLVAKHSLAGSYWISRQTINDSAYAHGTLITWHPVITGPEDTVSSKQFLHVSWARRSLETGNFDIMYDYHFFSTPTAISEIPVKGIDLGVYPSKGGITVKGNGEYRVYRVDGKLIRFGISNGSETITLPRGAYIVKFNGKERTVIVR